MQQAEKIISREDFENIVELFAILKKWRDESMEILEVSADEQRPLSLSS